MQILKKLRSFKNRLTDRHMYSVIIGLIVVMIAGFTYQAKVSADYKNRLESQYIRAFDDLAEYVSTIETSLFKCAAVSSPQSVVRLANDIYAKAASASTCLSQLPLSDTNLENTSKFLSQVGDFTYMLALQYMENPVITEAQRQTMLDLSRYAVTLQSGLYDVQQKFYSGTLRFGTSHSKKEDAFTGNMEQLEAQFQEYPSLIYDGPFSDHVQNKPSLLLQNAPDISKDEAQARIEEIVSFERMGEMEYNGEMGGNLPNYMFTVYPDENRNRAITLQISKKGGMLLEMLDNRAVGESKIEIDEAKKLAQQYLEKLGFSSMRDSYFEVKDNIATINFAYCAHDIIYYPDLIKVRVAMDSGEILGMEASGYAINHTDRSFSPPQITAQDAQKRLSPALSVESVQLAVIPLVSQEEAFCYEFKCRMEDKTFLLYLSTETGDEEDVLMLLETEGGMLTI